MRDRRTGKRKRTRTGGYPDLTSFSDIAFLLIIYFILATSFSKVTGLKTDIPSGRQAEQASEKDKTIMLRKDGLYYGEDTVTFEELRAELGRLKLDERPEGKRVVQFEAKAGVQWQEYYEVLATIRASGGQPGIVMEAGDKD